MFSSAHVKAPSDIVENSDDHRLLSVALSDVALLSEGDPFPFEITSPAG